MTVDMNLRLLHSIPFPSLDISPSKVLPEMGTREVYEAKRRNGSLHYHQPRPRFCSLPLSPNSEKGEWTVTAVAGSGIFGMLSAVHGFNTGIPYLQNRVKGPKWLPFVIGLPPLLLFSGSTASFRGYALPKFAQLTVTSHYASSSASHYGISLLTRHIGGNHTSRD